MPTLIVYQPNDVVITQRDSISSSFIEKVLTSIPNSFIGFDSTSSVISIPQNSISGSGTTLITASIYQITSSQAISASWSPTTIVTTTSSASWVSASAHIITSDTASYVSANNIVGIITSFSSSWASASISASWSPNQGATLITASTYPITSSFAISSSWAPVFNGTASLFGTSSWATNVVSGGSTITPGGSYNISASWSSASISASYAPGGTTATYTSSLYGTASWANNATSASWVSSSISTSYADKSLSASYADTASYSVTLIVTQSTNYQSSASWASQSLSASWTPAAFSSIGRPEMYGAVGDGITDDWIAIKNCILSHSVIEFDAKTYAVRGQIPVPSNTTFRGKGMGRTTLKIMDNSPYGYADNITLFTPTLVRENIRWLTGSTGLTPIGTKCGSGSVNPDEWEGWAGIGDTNSIDPHNDRWTMGTGSYWLNLKDYYWVTMRRNVLICDMTLDGNFDNQAKHSSFNWEGWASSSVGGGVGFGGGYYLPQYANKVRSTCGLIRVMGENIIVDHVEVRGFGAGISSGASSSVNVPDIGSAYNENFVVWLDYAQALSYDLTDGVENCSYVSSFRDATTFPWPITAQVTFKPSRILNCIATNPGNPDYQNPTSNQTVLASPGVLMVRDIDGTGAMDSAVDLLSSVENCTIVNLYPRCPSTASIWSGSILSYFVSSSYTYENLTGSYDGIIPGNGYLTGSIGQWAIITCPWSNISVGAMFSGKMKKINDGSPYGRWELKNNLFEYKSFFGGGAVSKNNYGCGMEAYAGQDTWQYSRIVDGNTFIDVTFPISVYVGTPNSTADKYIIKNNYIQLLDRNLSDDVCGNQGVLSAMIIGANQDTNILHKHKCGEQVIQNNTIRIPAASSRYWQEYFPNINNTVGINAPWELQNFSGSISGSIIGHNIANISIVTASLSTLTNGYITASFTSSIAHGLIGANTVDITHSISPYLYLNTSPIYHELPGVTILEVPTSTTFKCLIPADVSDTYGITISGSNVFNMSVYNAYFSGSYSRSFSQFSGEAYLGSRVTGSAFFDRVYNKFQMAFGYVGYEKYKNSNTQRCNGIAFRSISTYTSASHLTIEGNTFINFNSSKHKGFNYNYNNVELADSYANWFNNNPIVFMGDSDVYNTSAEHQFDLTKYTDLVSSYCIENNYDDAGTLCPLLLLLPGSIHSNRNNRYNIPNYSKNSLVLERNSIVTPGIDISKNILSDPAFSNYGSVWHNNSNGYNGYIHANYSASLVQYSSSFTNQLQSNKTYIFNYMFYQSYWPTIFSPALTDAKVKIGDVSLFTWNNAIHNTHGDHRIYFTTTGSLVNPTGSFSIEFSQSVSPGNLDGLFWKVSIFEYYPTSSINFNVKNHIINLDDNLYVTKFDNTGSYITGSLDDINNVIGENIVPRNEEINIRTVQTVPNVYYNITWPSNINWLKNPNIVISSSIVNYEIKYDKGQLYGTHDVEKILSLWDGGLGRWVNVTSNNGTLTIT